MKLLLKLFLLCAFVFFHNTAKTQDSIKIISYNIQGMKPGTLAGFRLAHIMDELKNLDPDIIALQEINQAVSGNGDDNQGMAIKDALSEYFGIDYYYYQQFTHLSWDNQFREYVGIVSKYPVMDEGFFQLVTGVFPRKIIWNYIDTPIGKINFFSTHLSFNSSAVRIEQTQQIAAYLTDIEANNVAVNSIICGDFNDTPLTSSVTFLTENGTTPFYDSYPIANPGMPGFTVPSNNPNARIDYVFYTNNENGGGLVSSQTVMEGTFTGNFYRSDHLGVLSVFTTQPNKTDEINPALFDISIYPNPSTNLVDIVSDEAIIQIMLFDQKGSLLKTEIINSDKTLRLNISTFDNGLYTIEILTDKGKASRQFVKM